MNLLAEKVGEDSDLLEESTDSSMNSPVNVYEGRLKLRFVMPLEKAFQASYAHQYAFYMRTALAAFVVLFAGSGIFDYLLLSGEVQLLWQLRYVVGLPILLTILGVSLSRLFLALQQWVLSSALLTTVLILALMKAQTPYPNSLYYFTGLLIIQMAGLSVLRMQFRFAIVCSLLIPLMGFALQYFYSALDLENMIIQSYFYSSVSVLSLGANFFLERAARRDYIQKRLLNRKQEQLQDANDHLKILVSSDGLTGIANRRHFDEALLEEWRRAKRTNYPLALILIDIDFFKAYNDTYGHQQGDSCLKQVAKLISQFGKRPGDLVARYGGEEFVVVLPDTSGVDALNIANQICKAVSSRKIPHASSQIGDCVTISLGVAAAEPRHLNSCEELIGLADKSLYKAKSLGRNQVVLSVD